MPRKTLSVAQNEAHELFKEITAPATPASGYVSVYAKADGKLYAKDDAGTEYDLTATGGGGSTTVNVTQTSHGLSAGNLIRSNGTDNQYAVADKDAGSTADAVGYVTAVTDANNFTFQPLGHRITNNVPVATAGSALFVGDSGALTTTEPTTVGQISKPVGIITASGSSMVMFNMRGLEVAGATSLITSLDATAHRLFYSDGSGNVTELAFGADGTVLTSTGTTSAPAFETPVADYSMLAYEGGFY